MGDIRGRRQNDTVRLCVVRRGAISIGRAEARHARRAAIGRQRADDGGRVMLQPGDRAWYRYQIGGDREQVEFTTPVLILKTTTGKAYFVVFNRKTRRVIT